MTFGQRYSHRRRAIFGWLQKGDLLRHLKFKTDAHDGLVRSLPRDFVKQHAASGGNIERADLPEHRNLRL